MKKIIFIFFLSFKLYCYNNYIVMANDSEMLKLFRDDNIRVVEIANDISKNYDGVIIHLGNQNIFDRGGLFYYETSQKNLFEFINIIKNQNKKIYFWFFDSFGSEAFLNLYYKHLEILDNLKPKLDKYNFDGIVLDLEWINYNLDNIEIQNNQKLNEIIMNVNKIFDKKVYNFTSLIEIDEENVKRGYDTLNYDNYFPMLYIKDGGFYQGKSGEPVPHINDNRIENLREFYKNNFYKTVVSLESGIILKNNNNFYFIRNFNKFDKDTEEIMKNLIKTREFNNKYYSIYEMKVDKDFLLKKNDDLNESLKKDQIIYFFKVNPQILSENDIIWEYFKFVE